MNNDKQPIFAKRPVFFVVKKIRQHEIVPYCSLIALNPLKGDTRTPDAKTTPTPTDGDTS